MKSKFVIGTVLIAAIIGEENNTSVKGTKRSTFNSNSVAAVEATGTSTPGTSSNASNLYVRSWLEALIHLIQ